jgi:osmoprotectant transport system permease protein
LRGLVLGNGPNSWVWWSWIGSHRHDIYAALYEHLSLTVKSVALGTLIATPLAILASRNRVVAAIVVPVVNALYTVPSVALLGLLIPIVGLDDKPAVIALTLYTLTILVRNGIDGLRGVPEEVLDAADGMGYTRRRRLLRVELPLALPALMAGVRLATVSTIGLVTVTFIVNRGGLGRFINEAQQRDFRTPLVIGMVLSVVLAVIADILLVGVEKLVAPWRRKQHARSAAS